jgi:endonuclease YncB( thermonuclease family)
MKNKVSLILALLASTLVLTSCNTTGGKTSNGSANNSGTCSVLSDTNALLPTPFTDALAFPYASDYATKDFEAPTTGLAYGKVTLTTNTDGDTAHFKTLNGSLIACRFLGVNTPESTAKVEAWGVKASNFTGHILSSALNICLVNDIDQYGKLDSSGSRDLGFVWYQLTATSAWRLLNLELVEECYSKCLLFENSSKLNYLDSFTKAGNAAKACGYRVYGTNDPDYDYSDSVVEATIYAVRNNYTELGIDKDLGTSGKELRVKALVVGMIGDNMILRDLVRDPSQKTDDPYATISAYAGFNTSLASWVFVGDVVYFYCRATKFNGVIQLSDVKYSPRGTMAFKVLASLGDATWASYFPAGDGTMDPYVLNPLPSSEEEMAKVVYLYSEVEVTIRQIIAGDYDDEGNLIGTGTPTYYNEGKSGTTIYGYLKGTTTICNLRLDNNAYPKLVYGDFALGHTYRVKGYIATYYEKYQVQLFNNIASYHYVEDITA